MRSAVSVGYATQAESASAADFTPRSGTALFAPRERAVMVRVPIVDDAFAEEAEEFALALSNPVNSSLFNQRGIATIGANDGTTTASPFVTVGHVVVDESDAYAEFVIRLSAPSAQASSLYYSTSSGSATPLIMTRRPAT